MLLLAARAPQLVSVLFGAVSTCTHFSPGLYPEPNRYIPVYPRCVSVPGLHALISRHDAAERVQWSMRCRTPSLRARGAFVCGPRVNRSDMAAAEGGSSNEP